MEFHLVRRSDSKSLRAYLKHPLIRSDLFARDAGRPSLVRVAAKAYRNVVLTEPGEYKATLKYYNGSTTVANWVVRDIAQKRRAKNLILFIGDGMTTNMITGILPPPPSSRRALANHLV
jgi:hypothetical protein